MMPNRYHVVLFIAFMASLPLKLLAAQLLVWDIDYVPLIIRGADFLFYGGAFPAYGTLSSVAAYNMPFLVWMQMPALALTRDVGATLLITQLAFNALATWAVYQLGKDVFSPWVGLAGAALFTYSDSGITSAYTAWAQLLLPGFFALLCLFLWRWRITGRVFYGACAIVVATCAMMTHFSAILYYAVIVAFALLARPPLRWRPLLAGCAVALLLLTPYLRFQTGRDFADLRAFFNRQTLVAPSILAQYEALKPENQGATPPPTTTRTARPSVLERIAARVTDLPLAVGRAFALFVSFQPMTLERLAPPLFRLAQAILWGMGALFAVGAVIALAWVIREWIKAGQGRWRALPMRLTESVWGRYALLMALCGVVVAGLIATGGTPNTQPTYYFSLFAVQLLLVSASGAELMRGLTMRRPRLRMGMAILGAAAVALVCGLTALDRGARPLLHDWTTDTPLNRWSYMAILSATDWIANDWDGGAVVRISYDIMPENANLWWVAPWHSVDPNYRIGMSYDALLALRHGLHNANDNPIGIIESADYIVVYEDGLARYNPSLYDIYSLGAIYILKPR